MKRALLLALMLVCLIMAVGCQKTEDAAKDGVSHITGEELMSIITDTPDEYTIIDVRSSEQYNEGHVQGAMNISIDDIKSDISLVDKLSDKKVVLICNTGNKSGQVAQLLVEHGFNQVYDAEGVKNFDYGELLITQ